MILHIDLPTWAYPRPLIVKLKAMSEICVSLTAQKLFTRARRVLMTYKYTNTYYGRGYVQLTWDYNYRDIGAALGMGEDLLIHPEKALDPDIAYKIMSYGMRKGSFTGKKLSDYIHDTICDYKNARRIINGLDQWALIKGYAEKLEAMLRASAPY